MTETTLKTQITDEMKTAMKSGDKVRLGALRMLIAAIQNKEARGGARALRRRGPRGRGKEVKKRTESIEAFEHAGRDELAAKERAEREVLGLRPRAAGRRRRRPRGRGDRGDRRHVAQGDGQGHGRRDGEGEGPGGRRRRAGEGARDWAA